MKTCKHCNIEKDLSEFRFRKDCQNYRHNCKPCESIQKKEIYYRNHEKYLAVKKQYRDDPTNKEKRRIWDKNKRDTDPHHRLRINLRNRLNQAIKSNQKAGSAVRDLGCSIEDFKIWLEQQFQKGMTWENHGEWHIDHIIPLSEVDLTDRIQFKKACHWFNLRPLWAEENLSRNRK